MKCHLLLWVLALSTASCQLLSGLVDYEADVPVANGEECGQDSDCESNWCVETTTNDMRCADDFKANTPCDFGIECGWGRCIARSEAEGAQKVCVSWPLEDKTEGCNSSIEPGTLELSADVCRHFDACNKRLDFSACVNAQCVLLSAHEDEVSAITSSVLRDESCCLPAGKGVCGTAPQCGCPQEQKCVFTGDDGTTGCVPVGKTDAYQTCDAESCEAGFACLDGLCRQLCSDTEPALCGANAQCAPLLQEAADEPIPGAFYCTQPCNLADPAAGDGASQCSADATCRWLEDHADCAFVSEPEKATGTHGESCDDGDGSDDPSLCAKGHFCESLKCHQYCRVGSKDCKSGSCEPFGDGKPRTVAKVQFGRCSE